MPDTVGYPLREVSLSSSLLHHGGVVAEWGGQQRSQIQNPRALVGLLFTQSSGDNICDHLEHCARGCMGFSLQDPSV